VTENPECTRRSRPLVLTVDDEPCISRVVQLKLENAGYEVVRASSGADGLQKFISLQPDVLITDVKMPGMSGIELCQHCEQYRGRWPFLIIVLTSQLDQESHDWLQSDPLRIYHPKPFSPREILRAIQDYIAGTRCAVGAAKEGDES